MFKKILGKFSKDIGIDLGTKNILVYTKERGIVINEPSVVAVNMRTDEILAVGDEARKMLGKTPGHIQAVKPLVDGVISDFEVAEKMIKYFIGKVHSNKFFLSPSPRVVVGIPLGITEVEKKAVEDAVRSAGAREVYLIEESIAAAVGARLPIVDAEATMIVDIGGGTTEISVISLGGIVSGRTLKIAGNELDSNITQYIRDEFNILIGEQGAENIKTKIGSASELDEPLTMRVSGRGLFDGLPQAVEVTDEQIRKAMGKSINLIIENIKTTLENTPPELVSDIYENGIYLTGGGALLRGLDKEVAQAIKIPVRVADDPLTCVVRGTGILLDDEDLLRKVVTPGPEEN